MWAAILGASLGCYLLKVAGLSVPGRILADPRVERIGGLLPVALLSAFIAMQTFTVDDQLELSARVVGAGVAVFAVWRRAPFLVVILAAMGATALVRALA